MDTAHIIEKAGGVAKVARALGLSHVSVSKWQRRGLPPGRVVAMHRLSGLPLDTVEGVARGHIMATAPQPSASNAVSPRAAVTAAAE